MGAEKKKYGGYSGGLWKWIIILIMAVAFIGFALYAYLGGD